jgi:hypothetical protein
MFEKCETCANVSFEGNLTERNILMSWQCLMNYCNLTCVTLQTHPRAGHVILKPTRTDRSGSYMFPTNGDYFSYVLCNCLRKITEVEDFQAKRTVLLNTNSRASTGNITRECNWMNMMKSATAY